MGELAVCPVSEAEPLAVLAHLAHDLWRRRMRRKGWRYGPSFDEGRKTHDAMVPFDALSRHDRSMVIEAVRALDIEPLLERAVDHDRGPEREFSAEEMAVGLRVGWAGGIRFEDPSEAEMTGEIVGWELEGEDLALIRVRWSDGEVQEHLPAERDLRRL